MFSLFRKRPAVYPTEGSWSMLEGEHEGRPMFVRRSDSGKALIGHADYKYRAGVAIRLSEPRPDGLPSKDEMEIFPRVEDALPERLQRGQASLAISAGEARG